MKLEADDGDIWAAAYRFEVAQGNADSAAAIKGACVAADPRHGEVWAATRKTVANWHDPVDVLLDKVAAEQQRGEREAAAAAADGRAAVVPLIAPPQGAQ